MKSYWIYLLFALAGFMIWAVLLYILRKISGTKLDFLGYFIVGPLHPYLKKRNYTLKTRELLGWGVVLILMISAPLISKLLENT